MPQMTDTAALYHQNVWFLPIDTLEQGPAAKALQAHEGARGGWVARVNTLFPAILLATFSPRHFEFGLRIT